MLAVKKKESARPPNVAEKMQSFRVTHVPTTQSRDCVIIYRSHLRSRPSYVRNAKKGRCDMCQTINFMSLELL